MKTVFWYFNDSYASVDIHTATRTLGRLGAEEQRMLGEKRCIRLAMAQLYRTSCSCSHLAYNQPRAAHDQAQGKAATTLQQAPAGILGIFSLVLSRKVRLHGTPRVCNTFLIFKSRTGKVMCDQRAQ
jgi:hypothetical protein